MLKKRVIFTLLYDDGYFMLSRNFRLQRVGDVNWLNVNYNFSQIAFSIDELIILNVSRSNRDLEQFCKDIKRIINGCFVPLTLGGGLDKLDEIRKIFRSGADKILLNSIIAKNPERIFEIASVFGRQSIVISVDVKKINDNFIIYTNNGKCQEKDNLSQWLEKISHLPIGELYLNSIDRDGTGQGFLLPMLNHLPENWTIPVIISGGAGNYCHLAEGLSDKRVNAVATANLFNFIGDGLESARHELLNNGFDLVRWNKDNAIMLKNYFIENNSKLYI